MSKWNLKIVNNQENMEIMDKFKIFKDGIINKTSKNIEYLKDNSKFITSFYNFTPEQQSEITRLMAKKTETAPINNSELFNKMKKRVEKELEAGKIKDFESLKRRPGFIREYELLSQKEQEEIKQLMAKKKETVPSKSSELFNETIRELKKKLENEPVQDFETLKKSPGFIDVYDKLSSTEQEEIKKIVEESNKLLQEKPPLIPVSTKGLGDGHLDYIKMKYHQLMQTIRKYSLSIEEYETKISGSLVHAMSGENHTNDDILLVKKHFASFLSLSVSCFVVYNWFYVMYFTNKSGERVKTLELSLTKIKQNSPIFHFFFKYTLCVLSMMDKLVLDLVPSTVSLILVDRRLQFIILFTLVYMIINNFGSIILNSVDSKTVVSAYVCIFVLYELYCVLTDFLPDDNGSIDISRLHKYMIFGSVTPLLYLMLFFVRMIWSIAFIGVASFINCAYILIMSFFSILLYSSSFFGTFKILNEFIWESEDSKSGPIEVCINILYRFLYEISFILILLLGIYDYSSNMSKKSQMSKIISCICSMFIFLFAFIAYQRFSSNGSETHQETSPIPPKESAYIDPPGTHQETLPILPKETVVTNDILTQPDAQNDKFNFLENKLIENSLVGDATNMVKNNLIDKNSLVGDATNMVKNKLNDKNSLVGDAKNMVKNKLVDTLMKTVKNSKYGKMIPTKLLSSIM